MPHLNIRFYACQIPNLLCVNFSQSPNNDFHKAGRATDQASYILRVSSLDENIKKLGVV